MHCFDYDPFQPLTHHGVFYGETPPLEPKRANKIQQDFAADLCVLMIVCNMVWWNVKHPFCQQFFGKWLPGTIVPGQRELLGHVLDEQAAQVEEGIKREVIGRFATGQCDGWKNIVIIDWYDGKH